MSARKIIAVFLSIMLLCLSLPCMSFASGSLEIDPINDVIQGGDGVGFYDNPSAAGARGLETHPTFGLTMRITEWVKYDISALAPGEYALSVVGSNTSAVDLSVNINDTAALAKVTVSPTSAYGTNKETMLGKITITEQKSIMQIKLTNSAAMFIKSFKLENYSELEKKQEFIKQNRPFMAYRVPCLIEAENFYYGVEGYAYSDTDPGNTGKVYREETNVDIYKSGKMTYVNMVSDEWMRYSFSVAKADNFDLVLKWFDGLETSIVRVFIDDYEVLRNVKGTSIPTGFFSESKIGTFYLTEGTHTIIIKCMEGDVNLDYFRFRKSSEKGMDISNKDSLRHFNESQFLEDEDKVEEERAENPVEREIYVDSSAKTGGDGSKEKPFNTIEDAKAFVRTVNKNMKGDIVVNLKGEFKVDKTLEFTKEDSGSGIYNIIYKGTDGTSVHGGRKIEGWKQVDGTPLYQTVLSDVEDFRQLYVGENRGVRARSEWLYYAKGEYDDPLTQVEGIDGYFLDGDDFDGEFSKPQYMEMVWFPSWRVVRAPLTGIEKQADGTLLAKISERFVNQSVNVSAPVTIGMPYYLENAPEFLDTPGEFYFDKDTKVLTYYPADDEDMNTIECYIPKTQLLLSVSGNTTIEKVRNITFSGIEFKYASWERATKSGYSTRQADQMYTDDDEKDGLGGATMMLTPANIEVDFAENVNFVENEFKHLGATALSIDNATSNCYIEGNIFDDISAAAITLGNPDTKKEAELKEYTRRIKVRNNLLRRNAVEYMVPVITGYYVNSITVDHNDILDAPYSGISMGWGWSSTHTLSAYNRMTNNRIENVLYKLVDGGHIYTLSVMKGGVISGNYLIKSGEWKGGIYHDNSSQYITSFNNVFEDCPKWYKITFGNVRDNTAYNNYSETPYAVTYPDINNVEKAKGKVNGEWPIEAKEIIKNAGLEDEYKYLLSDYNAIEGLRNATLARQPYLDYDILCHAGNYIEGGEGVAYHEIIGSAAGTGRGDIDEPSVFESYVGTGALEIMVTDEGEWTKHKITVDKPGEYDIYTGLAVVQDGTAVTVEVDGKVLADKLVVTPNCTRYEKMAEFYVGTMYLEPGEHIVKVEHAVKNFGFGYIGLKKSGVEFSRGDGFKADLMKAFK